MPFVNGFPTEEDIKIDLYLFEPEQLSDLVYVPGVRYINQIIFAANSNSYSEQFEKGLNFPAYLGYTPLLFQRYNPFGAPFADGYSLALYEYLNKYSYLDLALGSSLCLPNGSSLNQDYINYSKDNNYDFSQDLEITLPESGEEIIFSYYYPEFINRELTVLFEDEDPRTYTLEELQDWKNLDYGDTHSKSDVYYWRRISNFCIHSPRSRSWLLKFDRHFCHGQKITIDKDILIHSLVVTDSIAEAEDRNFILNQIPDYYLYKNLSQFFSFVDGVIARNIPEALNPRIATGEDYSFSVEAEINTFQGQLNTKELCELNQEEGQNCQLFVFFRHHGHPDNYYQIKILSTASERTGINYTNFPAALRFGSLIFANNNNWNNYNFELQDRGEKLIPEIHSNFKTVELLPYGKRQFTYDFNPFNSIPLVELDTRKFETGELPGHYNLQKRDDEIYISLSLSGSIFSPAFNRIDYSTGRLLIDSFSGLPAINYLVGNDYERHNDLFSVPKENAETEYYNRPSFTKVYKIALNLVKYSGNYTTYPVYAYAVSEAADSYQEKELGTQDFQFTNWGGTQGNCEIRTPPDRENLPCDYPEGIELHETEYQIMQSRPGGGSTEKFYLETGQLGNPDALGTDITDLNIGGIFVSGSDSLTTFSVLGQDTISYSCEYVPAQTLKPLIPAHTDEYIFNFITNAHETCYMANCDLEDLKKLVQEIHLSVEADHYAYLDGSTDTSRVWNLGRQIEAIATVLGLSFNSDGSIRSIRQGKLIKQGDSIPAGWNFGQFGKNSGNSENGQEGGLASERRFGIAYEVRSNFFTNDDFTGETNAIEQGGIVLCENIPQLLHFKIQDLDRALGMQDMGANVLPTPNGEIASYRGLNQMILDGLYTLSQISKQTASINVLSLKSQAMQQEIISGFGLPVTIKEIEITANSGVTGVLPFPGFALNSPTLSDLIGLNLLNTGSLIGSQIQVTGNSEDENPEDN